MKKALIGIVAIAAIVVIGASIKNNIVPQPASVTKSSTITTDTGIKPVVDISTTTTSGDAMVTGRRWCTVNGNNTISYGTEHHEGGLTIFGIHIGGHWVHDNPPNTPPPTMPGGQQACAQFLEGQ